ncbi:hypothetical protein RDABS01_011358 [Bienertia sinuspersici]
MSGDNLDGVNATTNGGKINFHDSSNLILSTDIIFNEILPRLPVKSLIRFKFVSKSWHSCITSPEFTKTHFNFSSSSAHQFILSNYDELKFWLLPYDEQNNLKTPVEIDIPDDLADRKPSLIYLVGVCNGLICLCTRYDGHDDDKIPIFHHSFSIWNPASHQHCEIVNPESRSYTADDWFGYIPYIDDYKIIAEFGSELLFLDMKYYVYSLKTKTTLVDNILYWSHYFVYDDKRPEYIVGLNLATEQVKQFPFMDWISPYVSTDFFEMNGCLSLYCCISLDDNQVSDVWTLKQHDDWSSWEKTFSVHHGGLHCVAPSKLLVTRHLKEKCYKNSG